MQKGPVIYYDESRATSKIGFAKQHAKRINDKILPVYQQLLIGNLTTEIFQDILSGSKKLTKDCHELIDTQSSAQGFAGKSLRTQFISEIDTLIRSINAEIAAMRETDSMRVISVGDTSLLHITINAEGKAELTPGHEQLIREEFELRADTEAGQKLLALHLKAVKAVNAFLDATASEQWERTSVDEFFDLVGSRFDKKVVKPAIVHYDHIAIQ